MERIQTIGNSCQAHIYRDMRAGICHRRDSLISARRSHSPGRCCLLDTVAAVVDMSAAAPDMAADTVVGMVVGKAAGKALDTDSTHTMLSPLSSILEIFFQLKSN